MKYEDYRRFGANTKIIYEGKEVPKGTTPPDQKPPDQKKPDNPNPQN